MSYAGPVNKRRPDQRRRPAIGTEWSSTASLAAGVVLGLAVGAGATLLLAPQSGSEARHDLARRGRRLRRHLEHRGSDAWDDLRHELRRAARHARRRRAKRQDVRRRNSQIDDD